MIDSVGDMTAFEEKGTKKKDWNMSSLLAPKEWMRHRIRRGKYLAVKPQFAVNYAAKTWKTIYYATSRFRSMRGIVRPRNSLDDFWEESGRAEHSTLGMYHCKIYAAYFTYISHFSRRLFAFYSAARAHAIPYEWIETNGTAVTPF